MKIERIEELELTTNDRQQVAALLKECFGVYPEGKSFYKQLPGFRILARDAGILIGHLAAEYRMINVGGSAIAIFGVADLCVTPSRQQERIATQMLAKLEALAIKTQVEFIILTGSEPNVYEAMDFERISRECRWLLINNLQTLGVIRRFVDNIMVKPIGQKKLPAGEIDFLGHIF